MFTDEIIARAVRWYVRYRLSYAERRLRVAQSTVYRWVQRFLPLFAEAARKNFGRAVAEARTLKNDLSRALALIAVADSALAKNSRAPGAAAR